MLGGCFGGRRWLALLTLDVDEGVEDGKAADIKAWWRSDSWVWLRWTSSRLDSGVCHEMMSSSDKLLVHERDRSEVFCMSKLTEREGVCLIYFC